jgi:hypothetical protein
MYYVNYTTESLWETMFITNELANYQLKLAQLARKYHPGLALQRRSDFSP